MDLRSDSSGFLLGNQINLSQDKERLQLLREIKADTAAMLSALSNAAPKPGKAPAPAANGPVRAQGVRREAANAPSINDEQVASRSVRAKRGPRPADDSAQSAQRSTTPRRGTNGRFQRDGDSAGGADPAAKESRSSGGKMLSKVADIAASFKNGIGRLMDGTEQVDPAIAATKEMGSILSPIMSPIKGAMGFLFKRRSDDPEAKAVPWYRRMYGELRTLNKNSGNNRAPAGPSMGGIGGLLSKIPGVGAIVSLLSTAASGLKPLLGMMAKAAVPVAAIFSAYESLQTTTEDYAKRMGVELDGSLAQELGVRFVGVLGDLGNTLTMGMAGKFGEFMAPAIADMIEGCVKAWTGMTDWVESGFKGTLAAFDNVISSISKTFDEAGKWLSDKVAPIKDMAVKAGEAVTNGASALKDFATGAADKVGTSVSNGASAIKDFATGTASKVAGAAGSAYDSTKSTLGSYKEAAMVQGGRLVGALDRGYRHKEKFEGIKGGDSLAKYGSYTNDEAARIRELKSSGANTSANLKDGMPLDVRNKIIAQAKEAGLNPEDMLQIAAVESGGNPNAISSTGATGIYQMTGQTATGLGITDRFDADQNIAGGMKLAQANAEVLRKKGLPVNRDNLYMMHQLGPTAATDMIKGAADGKNINELSVSAQTAAGFNVGGGSKTAKDYMAKNSAALDARLGKVSKGIPATLAAPTPASAAPASTTPSVATAAPPTDKQTPPPTPAAPNKLASNNSTPPSPLLLETPLTQNVADRGIAQAATGGIGMNLGAR